VHYPARLEDIGEYDLIIHLIGLANEMIAVVAMTIRANFRHRLSMMDNVVKLKARE
jgi:hypothetical protein